MENKKRILWITRTALLTALLIAAQAATAPLGNSLVTGSIVNLLLVVSTMTCGPASGISVAVISPIAAKLFGIGPFWSLIPFIAAGNVAFAAIWHLIGDRDMGVSRYAVYIVAAIAAAIAKFAVLYGGVVQIAVPLLLRLPEPQATVISNMFSIPQLVTAIIGGALAILIFPRLKKALK